MLLAIDTCLPACSVAVLEGVRVLAAASEPMERGHQERLAPLTAEVMREAGVAFADLRRIGVTVGPGSFTGLRVGLAFAKGLGLALGREVVGVGTLHALAASAAESGLVAAAIDARREQLYLQAFRDGVPLGEPEALTLADAAARLRAFGPAPLLAGSGAALLRPLLPGAGVWEGLTPDPAVVGRLAGAGAAEPRPLYLRAPDAKLRGSALA